METLRRITALYKRICSIQEIESESIVQWMFGAMLFYFFVTFSRWISDPDITTETAKSAGAVCWPYFQHCTELYFLSGLPAGYSQSILYMVLYAVMLLIVYCMWRRQWVYAHLLMLPLFFWKVFVMFVLSYTIAGPYDYYHIVLTAALLFIPYKEYFMKLLFVLMYFLSVTIKLSPAWIDGSYFSSLSTGLPLIPRPLIAIATNIVIFLQIVECWFLLSSKRILQRISLTIAVLFHLYSGILVYYNYPSITLPAILILFGPKYRFSLPPFSARSIAGWIFVVMLVLFQLLGFAISPDRFLTLEGNRYGMFMFDSNHQCVATVTMYYSSRINVQRDFQSVPGTACSGFWCLTARTTTTGATGTIQRLRYESGTAWNRCDPYEWWSRLKTLCDRNPSLERAALVFDHSLNGGPFYRIVDTPNICDLTYHPFSHNSWIQIPPEAPIVGYPVQNWYHY